MGRLGLLLIAAVGGMLIASAPGEAILVNLTPEQIREALDHGTKNFDKHPTAFKWAYYYDVGYGYPNALLRTEYFAISDYVRRSEFQREYGSQRVHKVTPERIDDARREAAGKLQFIVTLYGETDDLADQFRIHLETADGRRVAPLAEDKPVQAAFSGFGGRLDRMATVVVDFPLDQVDPNGKVKLVIVPPPGLGPSGARNDPYVLPFNLAELK